MDRAYDDARAHGWSREPVVEMLIPSTLDDTLAPAGRHVASLFCQHVAPELPGGKSWDEHRDEVADLMIATVDRYAPGFAQSVLGRQALTPLDLEREFGLLGGDIFHGALTLNQLFSARPMLGHADYRGPMKGLYHCGIRRPPGRRRHRRTRPQRRAGDPSRSPRGVWIRLWMGCGWLLDNLWTTPRPAVEKHGTACAKALDGMWITGRPQFEFVGVRGAWVWSGACGMRRCP